jgi:hypothetical protein
MTTLHLIPKDIQDRWEVREWRNAAGVLSTACRQEWDDLLAALRAYSISTSEVIVGGKNRSALAKKFDAFLTERGWIEKQFHTAIKVDAEERESPTHKVDCYKNRVALEMEWNNKDPFFDRDLNNFRLLFDLRVIDVGIIVTRCSELQAIFKELRIGSSYGNSTTHMQKLLPRLEGGGGGGCPVLVFGISPRLYVQDIPVEEARKLAKKAKADRRKELANEDPVDG